MSDSDQDHHNFSTPSSHRLPTISGTQAIRNAILNSRPVPTGLASLDSVLNPAPVGPSGLRRGLVTEIFGPPGVGKTTLALQAAVNTICHDNLKVLWIDTSASLVPARLLQLLEAARSKPGSEDPSSSPSVPSDLAESFNYLEINSLPKLLAMFMYPLSGFPPADTSLVVLDDLSNLILSSLPRKSRSSSVLSQLTPSQVRADHAAKQAISRRAQIISSLACALQSFATTHNVSLVVTCKARISLKTGQQAFLQSALASQQWDTCLGARIVLYRDFWPAEVPRLPDGCSNHHNPTDFERRSLRYAQALRLAGKEVSTNSVGFVINQDGLREVIGLGASEQRSVPSFDIQGSPNTDELVDEEAQARDDDPREAIDERSANDANKTTELPILQNTKRKAVEIVDSDEDDELPNLTSDALDAEADKNDLDSHLPKSQPFPTFQSAKRLRSDQRGAEGDEKNIVSEEDGDEMLLDQIEAAAQVPAFSQAAADMSDPLTPSDDGNRSP